MIASLSRNPNLTLGERHAGRSAEPGQAVDFLAARVEAAAAAEIASAVKSFANALEAAIGEAATNQRVAATDAFLAAIVVAGAAAALRRASATDRLVVALAAAGVAASAQLVAVAAERAAAVAAEHAAAVAAATDAVIAGIADAGSAARAVQVADATDAFVIATVRAATAAAERAAAVHRLVLAVAAAAYVATERAGATDRALLGIASAARAAHAATVSAATDSLIVAITCAGIAWIGEIAAATDGLLIAVASAGAAAAEFGAAVDTLVLAVVSAASVGADRVAATERLLLAIADAGAAAERAAHLQVEEAISPLTEGIAIAALAARTELSVAIASVGDAVAASAAEARGEIVAAITSLAAGVAAAAQAAPAQESPPVAQPQPNVVEATHAPRRKALVRRGVNALLGSGLLVVYLLSSVVAVASVLLLLNGGTSSAVFRTPDGPFFHYVAAALTVALVAISLRYVYFYACWFDSRRHFGHARPVDVDELRARDLPYMKFQVTTKGGAMPVVERSLRSLEAACDKHWWLRSRLSVEVITEVESEAKYFERTFRKTSLRVTGVCLPADYQTPNGTGLKARALHYMVEQRREGFNAVEGRCFIVHLDEETLITEPHLLVLIDYLSRDPRPVSQGPIYYPLEWAKTPWICRAIESTRPFGCSECARVMQHPPPPHLHGSNLVVDEAVENQIGWDFGKLEGNAFVAEDLLFGLRAYAVVGEEAFGWHGATMLEQPPLSLHWAIQQRLRWVLGALQGLRAMWGSEAFSGISLRRKLRLHVSISYRIATYAGGFPVGLTGLVFLLHPLTEAGHLFSSGVLVAAVRGALLFAALGWVVSYQIGMVRNLRYQDISRTERLRQMGIALLITPITGLCETVGPFIALTRWLFGVERVSWTPTPKLAKEDNAVAEVAAVRLESPDSAA